MANSESIPKALPTLADPSETSLLEHLKTRVSRLMLEEISENDNGEEASDHLAGIERHMNTTGEPPPLSWCPREVLELQRWDEPSCSSSAACDVAHFEREHLKRLMACAILLRSAGHEALSPRLPEKDFFLETSAASLVQMIRSVFALDASYKAPALAFVLWLHERQSYIRLQPFAAFSALLLAATMADQEEADARAICEWVDAVEARSKVAAAGNFESDRWLIGLNSYEDSTVRRGRWKEAAQLAFAAAQKTGNTRMIAPFLERLIEADNLPH